MFRWFRRKNKIYEIHPDEIFLDAHNSPSFNQGRLEGRMELPLRNRNIIFVAVVFALIAALFLVQLFSLQIQEGKAYRERSENNRLDRTIIFATRGVIVDRTGEQLAWNVTDDASDFPLREYSARRGIGQLLGYVQYPKKDTNGYYFRTTYEGASGIEETFSQMLAGREGERYVEVGAQGEMISEHVARSPVAGKEIQLSIDAELSEALFDVIATTTETRGFRSGVGAMIDVETGEIVALANYPSFDPNILADGQDSAAIAAYNADTRLPFLNKMISGLYTPGSIVKPFMALAALGEGVISPEKEIVSEGKLVVPNPYNPDAPSIFSDWKAHGAVDMRRAIAVSSNVYFYQIGGGFGSQKGVGITNINKYMRKFGIGSSTNMGVVGEIDGVVPSPAWKEERFEDGTWRLGDTYLTAIGQFGFQTTPIQMLRAYAALANGGILITPTIEKGKRGSRTDLEIPEDHLKVVQEGMRGSVLDGTARALNMSDMHFAGKTGTAEIDAAKDYVNSWVAGYYPYEKPKYAFILLLERGPYANLFGASPAMWQFFTWMKVHKPEYYFVETP